MFCRTEWVTCTDEQTGYRVIRFYSQSGKTETDTLEGQLTKSIKSTQLEPGSGSFEWNNYQMLNMLNLNIPGWKKWESMQTDGCTWKMRTSKTTSFDVCQDVRLNVWCLMKYFAQSKNYSFR